MTAGSIVARIALGTAVASVALASDAAPASTTETATGSGRPPGPARNGLAPIFQGTFTHAGWRGSIVLALTPDGREVMNVGGTPGR
jgi:hypothetical protein